MELGDDCVDLDAVAGGKHNSLQHLLVGRELVQGLGQALLRNRQAAEEPQRSGLVVEAEGDYGHGLRAEEG